MGTWAPVGTQPLYYGKLLRGEGVRGQGGKGEVGGSRGGQVPRPTGRGGEVSRREVGEGEGASEGRRRTMEPGRGVGGGDVWDEGSMVGGMRMWGGECH